MYHTFAGHSHHRMPLQNSGRSRPRQCQHCLQLRNRYFIFILNKQGGSSYIGTRMRLNVQEERLCLLQRHEVGGLRAVAMSSQVAVMQVFEQSA